MSSFPSDEQFDQCVAESKRAAQAIDWKNLPTNVVYRVQPRGSVKTKRGSDTYLELVNRENEEVKVWAPPSLITTLYSAPPTKKIPYIRSLGPRGNRKVFEIVFFRDHQPSTKIKIEEEEQLKLKQQRGEACKRILEVCDKIPCKEKKQKVERKSKEKNDAAAAAVSSTDKSDVKIELLMDKNC